MTAANSSGATGLVPLPLWLELLIDSETGLIHTQRMLVSSHLLDSRFRSSVRSDADGFGFRMPDRSDFRRVWAVRSLGKFLPLTMESMC